MVLEVLKYVVLAFGIIGITLGLYGLLLPQFHAFRPRLSRAWLPRRLRFGPLPENADDDDLSDEAVGFASDFDFLLAAGQPRSGGLGTEGAGKRPQNLERLEAVATEEASGPLESEVAEAEEPAVAEGEEPAVDRADDGLHPALVEAAAEAATSAPEAGAVQSAADEMLALFTETADRGALSVALQESLEDVAIGDLLSEARGIRSLLVRSVESGPED